MKRKPKVEKNKLIDLYEEYKSIHKVGKILNVSGDTISRWLKFYNITILNDPKRFDFIRSKALTQLQHEFVIGSLLGDGNIDFSGSNSRIRFCHGLDQLEYLKWKKELLGDLVQQEIHFLEQKDRNSTICSFGSIQHPDLNKYGNIFYSSNEKDIIPNNIENLLSDFVLAVWFMDDGWRSQKCRSALFCTESFLSSENEKLVLALKNKFNINTNLRKSSNRIVLYGDEVDKLSKIIQPYLHTSFLYKIGLSYSPDFIKI